MSHLNCCMVELEHVRCDILLVNWICWFLDQFLVVRKINWSWNPQLTLEVSLTCGGKRCIFMTRDSVVVRSLQMLPAHYYHGSNSSNRADQESTSIHHCGINMNHACVHAPRVVKGKSQQTWSSLTETYRYNTHTPRPFHITSCFDYPAFDHCVGILILSSNQTL